MKTWRPPEFKTETQTESWQPPEFDAPSVDTGWQPPEFDMSADNSGWVPPEVRQDKSEQTLATTAAASPFLQHWMGSDEIDESEKARIATAFREEYEKRAGNENTDLTERFYLNAKDAFFGGDSVGTAAGAFIDWYQSGENQRADVRAAQGRLLRYDSILEEFDRTGKKELYKDYQHITREKVQAWKDFTLKELDAAKVEAHDAKVEWLVKKAQDAGAFAGLPESKTIIEKLTALGGQIGGSLPTPENLIPGGAGQTVGRRLLTSAAWTVFGNAITEPFVQEAAQDRGVQEGYDLRGAIVRTGLGVVVNNMLTVSAELPRAIMNRFGLKPDEVKTGSVDEMIESVADATGMSKPEAEKKVTEFVGGGPMRKQQSMSNERGVPAAESKPQPGRTQSADLQPQEDGTKELGFVTTVKESPNTVDPVRQRVAGVYDPIHNIDTLLGAQKIIDDKGEDAAELLVHSAKEPTAETYAIGMDLMRRWQLSGDYDRAANIVQVIGGKAKTQGQAIQALSMWNRLTPEGALRAAQKELESVGSRTSKDARKLLRDVRKALSRQLEPDEVQRIIDDNLNIGNNIDLWPRYRKTAARAILSRLTKKEPGGRAALDEMTTRIERFLDKRLSEVMPPQGQRVQVNRELYRFGDFLQNPERAREMVDELRQSVGASKKLSDDEKKRILGEITVNSMMVPKREEFQRVIEEQLKRDKIDISSMVRSIDVTDEVTLRKNYGDKLIERLGIDPEEAPRLAQNFYDAISKKLKDTRESELGKIHDRINRGPITRKQKQLYQKVLELHRLGATDEKYNELFAKSLKAETLTATQVEKITRLALDAQAALKSGNEIIRMKKAAELADAVHGVKPADASRMAGTASTIALLLNPKTMVRNIGGNVILFGGNFVRDVASVPLDAAVGVVTGRRSTSIPSMKAMINGLSQPARDYMSGYKWARNEGQTVPTSIRDGVDTMLTMARLTGQNKMDMDEVMQKSLQSFRGKWNPLTYMEAGLSAALSIPDRSFRTARFNMSLDQQVRAAGVVAPTEEMIERAHFEANRAIFQNDNIATQALSKIKWGLNLGKGFGAGDTVSRFTRVPVNILLTASDWSPVGAVKTGAKVAGNVKKGFQEANEPMTPVGFLRRVYHASQSLFREDGFTQRDFVQGMTEAFIGSGAQIAGGYMLADMGIISGIPDADPELRDLRRMTGFDAYKINLSALRRLVVSGDFSQKYEAEEGDVIYSYNWAAPFSLGLAAGASMQEAVERGQLQADKEASPFDHAAVAWAAFNGAVKSIEEEPLFAGVGMLARSFPDANESFLVATGQAMAGNMPGLFMPTALSQVNQVQDNRVRETRGGTWIEEVGARLASRVPGLAQRLPGKYDILGQPMERYQNATNTAFNVFFSPGFLSRVKKDPYVDELIRLYESTGETRQIPDRVGKKVRVGELEVELNREQVAEYQKIVGSIVGNTQRMLVNGGLMQNAMYHALEGDKDTERAIPYHAMTDAQRVDSLAQVMRDSNAVAKFFLFGEALKPMERMELLSTKSSKMLMAMYMSESPEEQQKFRKYLWQHGADIESVMPQG